MCRFLPLLSILALTACGPVIDDPSGDDTGAVQDDTGVTDDTGDPDLLPPDPEALGSHAVLSFSDQVQSGSTSIPVDVYAPDDVGPHPVVVFTHGYQLSTTDYASYGHHLASWGFVVVMPQMPGGLFGGPTHVEMAAYIGSVVDWSTGGALDVDPTRVGLAGHSMGGKLSLLVATSDARVKAVFGVDPVDSGAPFGSAADYPSVTPELMPSLTVPLGMVGEVTNASGGIGGQACAPAEDNFQQYFEHAASPTVEVEILGANHMSFLDDPDCGLTCSMCTAGTDDHQVTKSLTRSYLAGFFLRHLGADEGYRAWVAGSGMQGDVDAGLVLLRTKNGW